MDVRRLVGAGTVAWLVAGLLAGTVDASTVNPVDEFLSALDTPAGREFASQFVSGTPGTAAVTDPPGDFEHSTGQEPGYTPDQIDLLGADVNWFNVGALLDRAEAGPEAGGPNSTWRLFGCDEPPGPNVNPFTACPDPAATLNGTPQPVLNDFLAFRFDLAGPPPSSVPGRCEIVLWANDPAIGPPFAANASFPNDPADGTNIAWGFGFNPAIGDAPGGVGTFQLVHPGSGGFESRPTDALGIVAGDSALLMVPVNEVGDLDLITYYTFCVDEGYDYSPGASGADKISKVTIDLDEVATYQVFEVGTEPEATSPPTKTDLPTPTAEPGLATDASSDGGLPIVPIVIATAVVAVGVGTMVRRGTGSQAPDPPAPPAPPAGPPPGSSTPHTVLPLAVDDPCERLAKAHAEAQADAEAKRQAADESASSAESAEQAAADAREAESKANSDLEEANRKHAEAERRRNRPPANEEEAWIEDAETGERITSRDLRLRREGAAEAWDKYSGDPSQESAEQTEQDWKDLDEPGAREGRREADDADQAQRQADLETAEAEKAAAEAAADQARQAREQAESAARDAREAADDASRGPFDADAREAELRRKLEECFGLKGGRGGATTTWGPVGIAHDEQSGCFPEGNVELVVLDTFDRTVRLDVWVNAPEDSSGHHEAQRLAGEMRYWRDLFGLTSAGLNVSGAISGIAGRTVRDGLETGLSGAGVVAGEELSLDIPTSLPQVPVVILEGLAATAGTIFDAWGRWIENNHVGRTLQLGDVHRHVHLEWVEVRRCEGGRVRCVERYLKVELGEEEMSGVMHSEDIVPREPWRSRANGLATSMGRKIATDAAAVREFMTKYDGQPCQ